MSTDIFKKRGVPFVIHGGGLDLIFPHHENEIAQAGGADRPFATLWAHNGLVTVAGQKMSKSLGNFITLEALFEKADPEVIRFYFLQTHYRSPLDFSWEKLEEARKAYERFLILFGRIRVVEGNEAKRRKMRNDIFAQLTERGFRGGGVDPALLEYESAFREAMDDDLNTPEALAVLFRLLNHANWILDDPNRLKEDRIRDFYVAEFAIRDSGRILGLFEEGEEKIMVPLTEEERALFEKRKEARRRKDYKTADAIRQKLLEKGIVLEDVEEGTLWRRAR